MTRTLRPVPDPDLPRILPVILAGGSGTRLWPLSREQYPKQLIELISNESPLSATARRLNGLLAEHDQPAHWEFPWICMREPVVVFAAMCDTASPQNHWLPGSAGAVTASTSLAMAA